MGILKDFVLIFCTIFSTMMITMHNPKILFPSALLLSLILTMRFFNLETKIKNNTELTINKMELQKEKFLNLLTHDLRIPVIALLRALELFANGTLGKLNSAQQDIAKQTVHSCQCILNLITLLINAYKLDSSQHKLKCEKINLSELIMSCFEELQDEASEKNITLEYKCEANNVYLFADRDEIKNVLYNIVFTSIIHSVDGSKIAVSVSVNKNKNKIRLLFCGINGYESCNISNIDENYTSIGQNIRINYCKKIIETHQGQVLKNVGYPDLFEFELPAMMKL